jgi:hypothetical protein
MADQERQRLEGELTALQAQMQAISDEKLPWSRERYSRLLEVGKLLVKRLDEYTAKYPDQD